MNPERTVTHDWDWWAYQFRVVHRRGIEGIEAWDRRLLAFVGEVLDLKPGERLLDIGCGWGGLVTYAAEHYGVDPAVQEPHAATLDYLVAGTGG